MNKEQEKIAYRLQLQQTIKELDYLKKRLESILQKLDNDRDIKNT